MTQPILRAIAAVWRSGPTMATTVQPDGWVVVDQWGRTWVDWDGGLIRCTLPSNPSAGTTPPPLAGQSPANGKASIGWGGGSGS